MLGVDVLKLDVQNCKYFVKSLKVLINKFSLNFKLNRTDALILMFSLMFKYMTRYINEH